MTILGLDVSHWNTPDWTSWFANGYRFAFLKCTEGITWKDLRYQAHERDATDAGFKVAPYHYFRAQWPGLPQAQHFFANAGRDDMPPAVDIERTNNLGFTQALFASRLKEFLDEAERLFGRRPIIYTSKSMWEQLIGSVPWAADYDLWVAHYTTGPAPLLPTDWAGQGWKVWQYTSFQLDQNRFNGSEEDFLTWTGQDPTPPPDTVTLTISRTAAEELHRALHV
jgi:GH25 family lysozyme M1 (1,4-beta-N-acetylmuramidase)